jgi:O-antigen/teichoic acid export membrane protein
VKEHATFFRQSGWLMIANIVGGMMTWAVHFLAKKIPDSQYSIFCTLMMVTVVLPTMPLQMVFAQQTATALATNRQRQLAGMIRAAGLWILLLWIAVGIVIFAYQGRIVSRWGLTDPVSLWITLLAALVSLGTPLFYGALQGRQNFFWMGWAAIIGGAFRIVVATAMVLTIANSATGMMIGTLAGLAVIAAISLWHTSDFWSLPRERFDGRALLRQVMPLMFGFGVCQFMFTSDTLFAKAFFNGDEMDPYGAAGTLSRALLWLVLPLAAVMFPKLVHSNVRSEKSNVLGVVLIGTAVLSITGGLGLWLLGPWVVKLVYPAKWAAATTALLPWYAGAMVPLTLTNVLVNDLMARGRFRVVPVLVVLAVAYGFALPYILNHGSKRLEVILQTLAVFNLLMFAACAWAAFGPSKAKASETSGPR